MRISSGVVFMLLENVSIDRQWFSVLLARNTQVSLLEEASQWGAEREEERDGHDAFGMVVHAGIPEVESFEVTHGTRLHDLGKLEVFAEGAELREVVGHEGEFVGDGQVLNLSRSWGGERRRGAGGRR